VSTPPLYTNLPNTTMYTTSGVSQPSLIFSNASSPYTTTASYATAINGPLIIPRTYNNITINVKEDNTNSILYQIIGYTEDSGFSRPIVLATALPLSKNASDYQVVITGLKAIDVLAVDAVGGIHGSLIVDIVLN
jgi:hypothetical protein